jgi:hypothetical protein
MNYYIQIRKESELPETAKAITIYTFLIYLSAIKKPNLKANSNNFFNKYRDIILFNKNLLRKG